jgi:hypothetical protein
MAGYKGKPPRTPNTITFPLAKSGKLLRNKMRKIDESKLDFAEIPELENEILQNTKAAYNKNAEITAATREGYFRQEAFRLMRILTKHTREVVILKEYPNGLKKFGYLDKDGKLITSNHDVEPAIVVNDSLSRHLSRAGSVITEATRRASRENGKLGGRPPKRHYAGFAIKVPVASVDVVWMDENCT